MNSIDEYISQFNNKQAEWLNYFVNYMQLKHSSIDAVISYSIICYYLGSGKNKNFVAFSAAKEHFSLHTLDFEYIELLKKQLKKPGKGKACVNIPYNNDFEKPLIMEAIDTLIERHKNGNKQS